MLQNRGIDLTFVCRFNLIFDSAQGIWSNPFIAAHAITDGTTQLESVELGGQVD